MKYASVSILRGYLRLMSRKATLYIIIMTISLVSCSTGTIFKKNLPEKIKYSKIEFEPCAFSNSPYLCITESNAIQLVLEFKQCQEQNKLLREINGQ